MVLMITLFVRKYGDSQSFMRMLGHVEEKIEEHKTLVFEILHDGNLKFSSARSNFVPFADAVVFSRGEIIHADSPADGSFPISQNLMVGLMNNLSTADEAANRRRSEIAALASPQGKRIAQEKKHIVRSLSLEKVRRKRQDFNFQADKSVSTT